MQRVGTALGQPQRAFARAQLLLGELPVQRVRLIELLMCADPRHAAALQEHDAVRSLPAYHG